MTIWQTSIYTRALKNRTHELLLHNSFMGGFALIRGTDIEVVERCLSAPFNVPDKELGKRSMMQSLCDAGFFVPKHIPERKTAHEHLKKERNSYYQLIVMPHENCNFRCKYCYEYFERGRMSQATVTGLSSYVKRLIPTLKGLRVTWFGGEPLLARPQIRELSQAFLGKCDVHGTHYDATIVTNGYLLDRQVFDDLLTYGIRHFQITLDGPRDIHDRQRPLVNGKPTFDKIYSNLIAMKSCDSEFSATIRTNFGQEHTTQVMKPFIEMISNDFGADSRFGLSFNIVSPWGGPNDGEIEFCDPETQIKRGKRFRELAEQGGFAQSNGECLQAHGSMCYAGTDSSIVVGSDGTIYKCTVALSDPLNRIGFINDAGDAVIDPKKWSQWVGVEGKNVQKCGSCTFNAACQSRACPLIAIRTGEPQCPIDKQSYVDLVSKEVQKVLGPSTPAELWEILPVGTAKVPAGVRTSIHGRWDFN